MTWVIGRAGPFGYAVALSDICVTLRDGTERDCLQKVYKIAPQLVLGFAGSVAIGLEVVNQLSAALQPPRKHWAFNPQFVGDNLHRGTPELFESFPESEQRLGCELLLLGAHPTLNDGAAPWAKCFAYTYTAPKFEPELAKPAQIVSIGSGSHVEPYAEALRKVENDMQLFQMQTMDRDGAALGLMMSISSELKRNPVPGISQHLHICIASRDQVRIGKNDTHTYSEPELRCQMPPVATSLEELKELLSLTGQSSVEDARC